MTHNTTKKVIVKFFLDPQTFLIFHRHFVFNIFIRASNCDFARRTPILYGTEKNSLFVAKQLFKILRDDINGILVDNALNLET